MTEVPAGNNRLLVVLCVVIAVIVTANLISTCVALNGDRAPDISFSPSFNSLPASLEKTITGLLNFTNVFGQPGTTGTNKTKRDLRSYYSNPALTFSQSEQKEKRPYTIQYGADFGAYDYTDEEGEHKGFFRDLANAVCKEMNMDCRMVYDKYSNCLQNAIGKHPLGGAGLLGGYYDGCIGWPATKTSKHVMQFSNPITGDIQSYFYVMKGSQFDVKAIKGKKIGILDGSPNIPSCLESSNNVVLADSSAALRDILLNGEVDAVFANSAAFDGYMSDASIQRLDDHAISCTQGLGLSMMAKKDNDDFLNLWNEGFRKLQGNAKYQTLCNAAEQLHGNRGPIKCL